MYILQYGKYFFLSFSFFMTETNSYFIKKM